MKLLPGNVLPVNKITCLTKRYSCHISKRTDFSRTVPRKYPKAQKEKNSHCDIHIEERNVDINVDVLSGRNTKNVSQGSYITLLQRQYIL
jgi:hypothetical protein